jgi:hypothetical protein
MLQTLTNNVDARCMIYVIYFNDSPSENHNIELYKNNVMNIKLTHNQIRNCKITRLKY